MTDTDRQLVIDTQTLGRGATGNDPSQYAREICLAELAANTYVF